MEEIVMEFLAESREAAVRFEDSLRTLEGEPSAIEALAEAYRSVHMIKGTCGFLGYSELESVASAGERLLGQIRSSSGSVSPPSLVALTDLATAFREALEAIEETGSDQGKSFSALVTRLDGLVGEGDNGCSD